MTVRAIKVKGEQLSFLAHADSSEQLITGIATGETPTGWNFKVRGTYLYWVDDDGAERRKEGTATGESEIAGVVKVKGDKVYYGDDNGDERYVSAIAIVTLTVEASECGSLYHHEHGDYTAAHDAAVGSVGSHLGYPTVGQEYYHVYNEETWVFRAGFIFPTGIVLPDGCTIISGVLSLFGKGDYSHTDYDIVVVSGADLTDPLVAADYGDLLDDTATRGSFNTSTMVVEGWNNITLNATALTEISKTGNTKFGLRSSRDISSTTPRLNESTYYESVEFYGLGTTGKKPKLTITYS